VNEIREISVGVSIAGPVVVTVVIVDDQGAVSFVEKRMDIELAKSLQRKLDNAIVQAEGITDQLNKPKSDAASVEQQSQPVTAIGDELLAVINDLGKHAVFRTQEKMKAEIHFLGAIRRLRDLRETHFPHSAFGVCQEARDVLECADNFHRTIAGRN
jgi:seryl-tRNA synthetase